MFDAILVMWGRFLRGLLSAWSNDYTKRSSGISMAIESIEDATCETFDSPPFRLKKFVSLRGIWYLCFGSLGDTSLLSLCDSSFSPSTSSTQASKPAALLSSKIGLSGFGDNGIPCDFAALFFFSLLKCPLLGWALYSGSIRSRAFWDSSFNYFNFSLLSART